MQKQQIPLKNSLLLLLAAIIWGIAFVAQSVGMKYVGGFTFNAVRSLIGAVVLIPLIFILKKRNSPSDSASKASGRSDTSSNTVSNMQEKKTLIIGGIACGICLCLASNFQQFGIKYTTVGKAGFITACYIVIVPVIGLFLGKKCTKFIWAAVAMALIGLYLLCITDGFSIGKGDLLVLVCAFLFSLHILVIDYFSPKVDGVKLSCIQFLTCGILSGIPALLLEHPELSSILAAWQPILYAGVMSCGVAYTLHSFHRSRQNNMQSRSEGLFPLSSHQTACEFLLHTTIRLSSILLSTALYHTTIRCKPFFVILILLHGYFKQKMEKKKLLL